jgi:hypothetical protein
MVSDRIISIAQVYMAAYSCELSILAALVIGASIAALVAYGYGRDAGHEAGYKWGWELGRQDGYIEGQDSRYKRNAKGQFSR